MRLTTPAVLVAICAVLASCGSSPDSVSGAVLLPQDHGMYRFELDRSGNGLVEHEERQGIGNASINHGTLRTSFRASTSDFEHVWRVLAPLRSHNVELLSCEKPRRPRLPDIPYPQGRISWINGSNEHRLVFQLDCSDTEEQEFERRLQTATAFLVQRAREVPTDRLWKQRPASTRTYP